MWRGHTIQMIFGNVSIQTRDMFVVVVVVVAVVVVPRNLLNAR